MVRTFEFPPSCPFFGLRNSLADSEVFVYTLLPWLVTSSAACTYLCLPLAALTLVNSGLLVFRLVVPSPGLGNSSLHLETLSTLCSRSLALCLLPLSASCLLLSTKTLGYSGLLNLRLPALSGNHCLRSVAISRHCICCPRPPHCLQQSRTSYPVSLQLLGCLTPWYSSILVRSGSPTPLEVLRSALEHSITNSDVLAQNSGRPTVHLGSL